MDLAVVYDLKDFIFLFILVLIIVYQQISSAKERRDLLNRLMAKNLGDYAAASVTVDPPKMKIPDKSKSELIKL